MVYIVMAVLTSGAVNAIYGYTAFGFITVIGLQFIKRKKILVNALGVGMFWCLFTFSFTYAVISCVTTNANLLSCLLMYFAAPVLTYLAGWVLVELNQENSVEVLFHTLLFMTIGFTVHASLDYFTNVGHARWMIRDVFTGQIRSATGLGCINTFAFSLIGYWLFVEKRVKVKALALGLSITSILFGLLLGTRTQFVILFVTAALTLLLFTYENQPLTAVFKIAGILILVVGVAMVLSQKNVLNIRTLIETSTLLERLQDTSIAQRNSDGYRFSAFFEGIEAIFSYPFGGNPHHYYHNLWLDVSRVAGIVPFTAILLFTINSMKSTISFFKDQNYSAKYRYFLFSIYIGIYLNFFVEPIIEGFMDFFLAFVLIAGMVDACRRYSAAISDVST